MTSIEANGKGRASAGAVRVESLVRDYATPTVPIRALDGVTFAVTAGTTLAVVGPSGCGKSTLLGLLGGLTVPTAGMVVVDGQTISDLDDDERSRLRRTTFGYVVQSGNLIPWCTALENVALRLAIAGGVDRGTLCIDLLGAVGLGNHLHKVPDQLSRGQRQRVAVAAALVHAPCVILADEPAGALDAESANTLIEVLLTLRQESHATLVVVTHDESIACRMDRTISLRRGRIVPDADAGPPVTMPPVSMPSVSMPPTPPTFTRIR